MTGGSQAPYDADLPDIGRPRTVRAIVQWIGIPLALLAFFRYLPFPFSLLLAVGLFAALRATRMVGKRYLSGVLRLVMGIFLLAVAFNLVLLFSGALHILGLAFMGIAFWYLLAKARRSGMLKPRTGTVGASVLVLLVAFGLMTVFVSWLPCPRWCSRNVVKQADYRAMERIFSQPLPPSFRIIQVRYPGYSLVFNGPDGPLAAEYEVAVEKNDYDALMAGAASEEVQSDNGEWPAAGYQSEFVLKDFGNDWPGQYDQNRWNLKEARLPKAYRVTCPVRGTPRTSLVTVDDRDPVTVRLYLYTRVPYYY